MATKRKTDLALTLQAYIHNSEEARRLYKENDELLEEILEDMEAGDELAFTDKDGKRKKYVLLSNVTGAKTWKSVCFNHYSIEVIE